MTRSIRLVGKCPHRFAAKAIARHRAESDVADAPSGGSMPRAKSRSEPGSMLEPDSAFFTSVLKLKAGRWPS